ncbi:rhomboid family intramembrane serine protease [Aquimarina litoralis]|uniref:rhomboid family intramembrane serine protease n=1 Tax=Aquimarina litoralis TaxID=584605 RepID=UPI001C5A1705|nr:rhomboid family intramembrane serine protease [Aquimarina litoralis]MBW1294520.1 rhomboid family intramembrane serine protease [Aquimarina litoralis]
MRGISPAVKHILIINVIFWIGTLSIARGTLFENLFAYHFVTSDLFKPWQIFTHMFMHAGYVDTPGGGETIYFQHILFNMFGLWMFGTPVERFLGTKRFVFFYISAGLGALFIHAGWDYFQFQTELSKLISVGFDKESILQILNEGRLKHPEYSKWVAVLGDDGFQTLGRNFFGTLVGASGALMGVLVAFGVLFPETPLMLLFLPIPIKAKYFIPGILLIDLFSMLSGYSLFSPSNTAYLAHLGGALFGFLMVWYWKKNSFNQNRWN